MMAKFEAGDKAVLLSGGQSGSLHGLDNGDVVTILSDPLIPDRYKVQSDGGIGWAREDQLGHLFKGSHPHDKKLKMGDMVRLTAKGGEYPLHGYENGGIYTVTKTTDNCNSYGIGTEAHYRAGRVEIIGGEEAAGYALPMHLELVEGDDVEDLTSGTGKVKIDVSAEIDEAVSNAIESRLDELEESAGEMYWQSRESLDEGFQEVVEQIKSLRKLFGKE